MSEKTCGNCAHFVKAEGCDSLGICSEIYFEDDYGNDVFAAVRNERLCDNPSLFKPKSADTLEQRYEQLEIATKNLYSLCIDLHRLIGCNDSFALRLIVADLRELGVTVDG